CLNDTDRRVRSTLFPYTTLFRSSAVQVEQVAVARLRRIVEELADWFQARAGDLDDAGVRRQAGVILLALVVRLLADQQRCLLLGDRKSTRLHSSHQIISYAVFCL